MPITVVLADKTIYREEPEMKSASDDDWELAAISETARSQDLFTPAHLAKLTPAVVPNQVIRDADVIAAVDARGVPLERNRLPGLRMEDVERPGSTPPPRTIGIVGAELERAIADVLRYRAAVEDEQRLRAEMDGLLGRPARKRKGG